MFSFGKASLEKLATCHSHLITVANTALLWSPYDFSIIEGHRSVERQQQLFAEKKTHIDGVTRRGNHNYTPSLALDFLPYPGSVNEVDVWADDNRFAVIAGVFFASASHHHTQIRWGGDWDGDGNAKDQSLYDLPHIELVGFA